MVDEAQKQVLLLRLNEPFNFTNNLTVCIVNIKVVYKYRDLVQSNEMAYYFMTFYQIGSHIVLFYDSVSNL